jgi:hypothetical protein
MGLWKTVKRKMTEKEEEEEWDEIEKAANEILKANSRKIVKRNKKHKKSKVNRNIKDCGCK